MLCEVALGKIKEMPVPQYVENLKPPHHSVHGVGSRGPDYAHSVTLPSGIEVPSGPVITYPTEPGAPPVGLQHNEFVVYNTEQIRIRYLIQVIDKKDKKN
jgi:poly [ADP-ribose] polymerase